MKKFSFTVLQRQQGKRLDKILSENFPEFSRTYWGDYIKLGGVCINNTKAKSSDKLHAEDVVTGDLPIAKNNKELIVPKNIPKIIFQNDDVLVINKPAGLITHPTATNPQPSVAAAFKDLVEDSDNLRPGIVHRLDKDTSGVMILARNPQAKTFLQRQFKTRQVVKRYTALVVGRPKQAKARLSLPIKRGIKNPQKMTIDATGKPATSEYSVIYEYQRATLVDVLLYTGRTHQIRVQFAHIGHPVVGDRLYGENKSPLGLNRQFLHASMLNIGLPSGKRKEFKAPLASDLKQYLKSIE